MKKRVLSIVLALTLCAVTITGCGKTEPETPSSEVVESSATATAKPANNSDVSPMDSIAQSSEAVETPEEITEGLEMIGVNKVVYRKSYNDLVNNNYYCVSVEDYSFELTDESASKYPKLAKTLAQYTKETEERVAQQVASLRESYDEEYEYGYYDSLEDTSNAIILRADSQVFSWMESYYGYSGGAHGYYATAGAAFDTQTGEKIALADVITDEAAFKKYVADTLDEVYGDIFFYDVHETINEYTMDQFTWSLGYEGVVLYFNPYELASYADGIQSVDISFRENGNLLNAKYNSMPENYAYQMPVDQTFYEDIDGDGDVESIIYGNQYLNYEEYGYENKGYLMIEGDKIESRTEDYACDGYLFKSNGHYYVYFFHEVENDYSFLEIYDVTKRTFVGELYNDSSNLDFVAQWEELASEEEYDYYKSTYPVINNPESFLLESRLNLLSTYSGIKSYHVGDNGAPAANDYSYQIETSYLLKTLQDVPCKTVDEQGNVINANASLGKDQFVKIMRCDDGWVDLAVTSGYVEPEESWFYYIDDQKIKIDTSVYYRIECSNDYGFISTIGDVDVDEYFDGMAYAG